MLYYSHFFDFFFESIHLKLSKKEAVPQETASKQKPK